MCVRHVISFPSVLFVFIVLHSILFLFSSCVALYCSVSPCMFLVISYRLTLRCFMLCFILHEAGSHKAVNFGL